MNLADITTRVRQIVSEELCVPFNEVTVDSRLIEDLDADSLDTITLPFEIEQAWDIEISEDDADGFVTVGSIVNYLAERLELAEAA